MKTVLAVLIIFCFITSCRRTFEAPVPDTTWELFNSTAAVKLTAATRQKMEGIYSFTEGVDDFDSLAALKWSYTVNGNDTTYHLSMFCEKQAAYFICEGRRLDTSILLNGYWRRMVNTETGKARFTINYRSGGSYLLTNSTVRDSIIISGTFGMGEGTPDRPLRLKYMRQLFRNRPFEIVAHRGGGRTADVLPASENSVEIIKMAPRFGATAVEIDVRLTKDGVPVLFHDATLNERVIQKNGLLGPIENYTYAQLYTLVRLPEGERIPTLREALNTIVYNTPLRHVWLDTKYYSSLQPLRDLQLEYIQRASAIGRTVEILIGIPDADVQNNFQKLPAFTSIPSINEMSPQDVRTTNSKIWGPRWTQGIPNEEVARMHAEGRRVFVWTLDVAENIQQYLREGKVDGILSNYPSLVAYYYYVQQ